MAKKKTKRAKREVTIIDRNLSKRNRPSAVEQFGLEVAFDRFELATVQQRVFNGEATPTELASAENTLLSSIKRAKKRKRLDTADIKLRLP